MKKTTVTVGIAAFQAEANIASLLKSLLSQKEKNIKIEKIFVYSDGSKDKTVEEAKSIKSKKIHVISARKNKGFAYALQNLINRNKSQVFIELNDDIKIISNTVIEELIKPFRLNKNIGLVGGNTKALPPKTFIGKCIYTSYLAFLPLRYRIKNGETDLTCDGKILALSKDFAKSLHLKGSKVGNVDIYLFYENLRQKREYKFAKNAQVFYRLPETLEDYKNQERRARVSRKLMREEFGSLFINNHNISKYQYFKSSLAVFMKFPLKSIIFKLFINRFASTKTSFLRWKLALSTKKLSLILLDFDNFKNTL